MENLPRANIFTEVDIFSKAHGSGLIVGGFHSSLPGVTWTRVQEFTIHYDNYFLLAGERNCE